MVQDGKDVGGDLRRISRRGFCKAAAASLGGITLGSYFGATPARAETAGPLLPPLNTGRSLEICLNSRVSRHSGLGGTASDQQIANILWAAGRAPFVGSYRTINCATPHGTYIYHPETHSLEYVSGSTVTNALRITYDRQLDFDAGVSYMPALAASVALWTGTSSQVVSCPQMANLNFGINSIAGLTDQLVAISSDGSLPDPVTDGDNSLETVLAGLRLRDRLRADVDLSLEHLSQLLWAGYGCAAHMTANNRAGLTAPSWVAEYFLTNRIYIVDQRVTRYCNRVGSNLTTRDHRLDLVQDADVRAQLQAALPSLPEAPCYVLLCLTAAGLDVWYQRLETGFVAGGMLMQAGAIGLGCAFKAALNPTERANVQQITGIPTTDCPHAVVAIGHVPADLDGDGDVDAADLAAFTGCLNGPDNPPGAGCEPTDLDLDNDTDLTDYSEFQRR
ncbi:MAG: nitroreductase family protein [Phycisphaerae bacterium]|jgi:hypothetical protein